MFKGSTILKDGIFGNMKKCTKCKRQFPRTRKYFYQDRKTKDGFTYTCKECNKKASEKYRKNNRKKIYNTNKKIQNKYKDRNKNKTEWNDNIIKICYICKQEYPATPKHFHRNCNTADGLQYTCKECVIKKRKKDYKNYKKREALKCRIYKLKSKYGMDMNNYNKLFIKQKGRCAICGKKEEKKTILGNQLLSIDHNHKTGEIRGLLCSECNFLLGKAKDNIFILFNAIKYLRDEKYV